MGIEAIDHVQLAMPAGGEDAAVEFYDGILGITRVPKPERLAARGGCWFENDRLKVHLGVDPDFRAAQKAHPALIASNLDDLVAAFEAADIEVRRDDPFAGGKRIYVDDPFGNRIELIEYS